MTWRDREFAQLTLQDRSMLVEVLRCIPKATPEEGAHIRRDTLAVRLDCSVATITRLLSRLESLGWIVRDQVKSRIRGFQVGSIALTSAALTWLGFDMPAPQAQRCSPMSDASRLSEQSLQRQPPRAGGPADAAKAGTEARSGRARLPDSLQWLLDKVSPWGIFKLMGLATKRGHRLEDVTNQCREQIAAANNGYAYLQGLLSLDKDWRFVAEQGRAAEAADAALKQEQERLRQMIQGLEGRQFIGADGDVRKVRDGWVVVYAPGEATKALGASKGSSPITPAFLSAIEAGELRPLSPTGAPTLPPAGRGTELNRSRGSSAVQSVVTNGATHAGAALAIALAGLQRAVC